MTVALARRPETIRAEIAQDPERRQQLAAATAELLAHVRGFIERYVVLPSPVAADTCALYVLHTWAIGAADATPYMIIVSSEPGSGKTRALEVMGMLVSKPWHTSATTEVAMFRKIDQDHPTILLDELDTVFRGGVRHEALRAIINAGNRRGATVTRCDGKWGTREYETFGPKMMAGIDTGFIPDTILDRSLVIRMAKRQDEPVERLRPRVARAEAAPLLVTLAAWAGIAQDELARIEPPLPENLGDRAADAWEPLLAIADLASQDWATRAQTAAEQLATGQQDTQRDHDDAPAGGLLPGLEAILAPDPAQRAEQLLADARARVA